MIKVNHVLILISVIWAGFITYAVIPNVKFLHSANAATFNLNTRSTTTVTGPDENCQLVQGGKSGGRFYRDAGNYWSYFPKGRIDCPDGKVVVGVDFQGVNYWRSDKLADGFKLNVLCCGVSLRK